MSFSDSALIHTEDSSFTELLNACERLQRALELMVDVEGQRGQPQAIRDLADLRARFQEKFAFVALKLKGGAPNGRCQLRLLHIEKTIAGLVQLVSRHAVRKLLPSLRPFSLFYRVRQITATHPAIAPPQFA